MDIKTQRRIRSSQLACLPAARALCALAVMMQLATPALAGPREQAVRMHNRLTGQPPSAANLDAMATAISGGNPLGAAQIATAQPGFYNVTLANFVKPWTNRAQTVFVPMNDYVATVMGMVRDDVPFNTVLSADILYVGDGTSGEGAYSPNDNNMYLTLDANNVDLSKHLKQVPQSSVTGIPSAATAGIITTRGAASAFFVNGTDRK